MALSWSLIKNQAKDWQLKLNFSNKTANINGKYLLV